MTKHFFSLLFAVFAVSTVHAQEFKIEGHHTVGADSVWTLPAGSTIAFSPGASVEVLGGLQMQGTAEAPVFIEGGGQGIGFLINGINESNVELNFVTISGLSTPLRFDPFWHRPVVSIANVQFLGNGTDAVVPSPIVSIAEPYLPLYAPAQVNMSNIYFANNRGGMLIDGVGRDGWNLEANGMAFEFNSVPNEYHAPLHIEMVGNAQNYSFDNLLFNQNEGYGLSVTGFDIPVKIGQIHINGEEPFAILSKRNNYRLPELRAQIDTLFDATTTGFATNVLSVSHVPGSVELTTAEGEGATPAKVYDENGNEIEFDVKTVGNDVMISYNNEALPQLVVLDNGVAIHVPALDPNLLPVPTYNFEEGGSGFALGPFQLSTLSDLYNKVFYPENQPGFEPSWEVGVSAGFTMYDNRDLKMIPFSTTNISGLLPNVGLRWPGGYIGTGANIHLQHNKSSWWSNTMTLSAMNINGGRVRSFPYIYTENKPLTYTVNGEGRLVKVRLPFVTKVQSLDFSTTRHFRSYQLKEGKSGKWIPSASVGFGVMHFTPYRVINVPTTTERYRVYLGNTQDFLYNLRKVGTAGQNNIDGMSRYNSFATLANTSVSLTRLARKYSLTAELRGVLTSTDYLDDFGRGTFYGGDTEGFIDGYEMRYYEDPMTGTQVELDAYDMVRAGYFGGSMAQNYMPDGYWELNLKFNVFLDKNPLEKQVNYISSNMNKLASQFNTKLGAKRDSAWEIGAVFGTGIYDGRDLKYYWLNGLIPVPTNLEFSRGLYLQNNAKAKYSWNIAAQATNLSYYRKSGSPYIATVPGKPIVQVDSQTGETLKLNSYVANFFTKTTSLESNVYYHFKPYELPAEKKWNLVPSLGLGVGVMNYTPYREIRGLDRVPPSFLEWQHRDTYYLDLREVGSEGQNYLPNGRAYGKWAGLYNASFQVSLITKKYTFKAEVKSNMTTTDYLDDFGKGAWYGGSYERWSEALNVSYVDDAYGRNIELTPQQVSNPDERMNLFTPRARNNWADGYMQFHIGIAKQL